MKLKRQPKYKPDTKMPAKPDPLVGPLIIRLVGQLPNVFARGIVFAYLFVHF
jgi:hypothetical protein